MIRVTTRALVCACLLGVSLGPIPSASAADSLLEKAAGKPASASSTYAAGYEPGKAADNDTATRWSSKFADNQWWQVDLGASRTVSQVTVNWEAAYASKYRIQTSADGASWTTAADATATGAGNRTTSFTARSARYVRITGLTRATAYGVSFWDVAVKGPAEPTLVEKAAGKPATASSNYASGLEAGKANDKTATTRWSSKFADGQWWRVDLGASRAVSQVTVDWEGAYASKYRIQTSVDGSTWSTAAEVSASAAATRTTSFSQRSARYVRIAAVTRGTAYGVSFWDVAVKGPADSGTSTKTPVPLAPAASTPAPSDPSTVLDPAPSIPSTSVDPTPAPSTPEASAPALTTPPVATLPAAGTALAPGMVAVAPGTVPSGAIVVSPTGSDALKRALDSATSGDTIVLHDGDYGAYGTTTYIDKSGVTIMAFPGEHPRVLGYTRIGASNLTIRGLLFDGPTGPVLARTSDNPDGEEVVVSVMGGSNITIEDNEIRDGRWHAGLFVSGGSNIRVLGNYIHGNGSLLSAQSNLCHGLYWNLGSGEVAGNLVTDNVSFGLHFYVRAGDVNVHHNTVAGHGKAGIIVASESFGVSVNDNIVVRNAQTSIRSYALTGTGNSVSSNVAWGNGGQNFGDMLEGMSVGNNWQVDPAFAGTNDYRLTAGSPDVARTRGAQGWKR